MFNIIMSNEKNIDLLIVGPGGSGISYFIDYLSRNCSHIIIDYKVTGDRLKHISHFIQIPKNIIIKKCVYIYNDPLHAIYWHFRRKWHIKQIANLGNPYKLELKESTTFEDYLKIIVEKKKDLFGIKNHIDFQYIL